MWIDFEGIDGSGKTTVSTRVAEELRRRGRRVVHAREGGRFASPIAGRVRELVRGAECLFLAPEAELLLNLAREAQLLSEVVKPALQSGAWVITDRSIDSHEGLAQHVRGLSPDVTEAGAKVASQGLRPDRTFFIDVDPDIARWRRRVRKIRERRLRDGGRKGLLGDALSWRSRNGFHEFAATRSWTVVDNTWRPLEETVAEILAILEGNAAAAPPLQPFEADPENLLACYFEFAGSVRDRSLAAVLVGGLEDPRADAIRRSAPKDEAAYSVTGMDTPGAWMLRRELREDAPYYVARSLSGLGGSEQAWGLRRELEPRVPDQVLVSLGGEPGEEAYALRFRHWEEHGDECLRSVKGLGDDRAWELRRRGSLSDALAESLTGIDTEPAWALRTELGPRYPLGVLRSVRGIDHPKAWAAREELAAAAPKAVLATIEGMSGPQAATLRTALSKIAPEETTASLARVDTSEAWRLREEFAETAPVGVVKSLRGLPHEKGRALVDRILRRHPRRLRVAREAVQFLMRPERPPTPESDA